MFLIIRIAPTLSLPQHRHHRDGLVGEHLHECCDKDQQVRSAKNCALAVKIVLCDGLGSTQDRQVMIKTPARIEPCLFDDEISRVLADLVSEIQHESALLGRDLHPNAAMELADFVRVMNCYYSNLIEGHDTRPRDIERALAGAELDEERRPLALEARAHVLVPRVTSRHLQIASLTS
jgi:hypothetical protein